MLKTVILLYILGVTNPLYTAGILSTTNYSNVQVDLPQKVLTAKSISLENRYENEFVNKVFKDNILLTLNYLNGNITKKEEINWDDIEKPGVYQFTLNPGESFAFHDQIKSDLNVNVTITTNAHFNYQDGFRSDGHITGDGVCHLASLIYWASSEAGLTALAPTNHQFAKINEIPDEFGVSIYDLSTNPEKSAKENLYVTNNMSGRISFTFVYDGVDLGIVVTELNNKP